MEINHEHIDIETPATYFLRTAEGEEYGPASLDTIQLWCQEGRIGPDQMISGNQQDWLPVTEMDELAFDWILVLEDGTELGPFHLSMLEEQLREGNIPPDATFLHRHTLEPRPAQMPDAPERSPDSIPEEPTHAPEDAGDHTDHATAPNDASAASEPLDDEDLPASTRLATLSRHAAEAREQLAETRSRLQELRTEHTLLQDRNQHLQERVGAAESERDAAQNSLLHMQNQMAQNETELDNLRAQLAQMQEHYEKLQLENQQQFEQIDDLRATALTQEQAWKREISVMKASLEAKNRLLEEIAGVLSQDAPPPSRTSITSPSLPPEAATPAPAQPPGAQPQTKSQPPRRATPPRLPQAALPQHTNAPLPIRGVAVAIMAMLLIALIGLGVFSCSIRRYRQPPAQSDPAPSTTTTRTAPAPEPLVPDETLRLQPEKSSRRGRNAQPPTTLNWPSIELPGTTIVRENNALRIIFNNGLFRSGTRLEDAARETLLQLARQLANQLDVFMLIVEGHTDAIPVRPNNEQFIDNFSLGMARAETVKHFLAEQGGLPTTRIHTASAGQSAPPFPNDTAENRARNRTVVISIIP